MLYTLRVFGAVPWLIQDLDPDDLPLNLVATHKPDVVVQVLFAVERLDPDDTESRLDNTVMIPPISMVR